MTENEVATKVIGLAIDIHRELGPGMLESVYETILYEELAEAGLMVQRQELVPIVYRGRVYEQAMRVDLIVEGKVVVEVKSVAAVAPVHKMQVLTYLRFLDKRLGLLLNFNSAMLKEGIHRIVNRLPE